MHKEKTIADRRKELEEIKEKIDVAHEFLNSIDNNLETLICEDDLGIVFIPSDVQQEYDRLSMIREKFRIYIEILETRYEICAMEIKNLLWIESLVSE